MHEDGKRRNYSAAFPPVWLSCYSDSSISEGFYRSVGAGNATDYKYSRDYPGSRRSLSLGCNDPFRSLRDCSICGLIPNALPHAELGRFFFFSVSLDKAKAKNQKSSSQPHRALGKESEIEYRRLFSLSLVELVCTPFGPLSA